MPERGMNPSQTLITAGKVRPSPGVGITTPTSAPRKDVSGSAADEARPTRLEWLLLGERAFSHPRYAILIIAALSLCVFERYLPVLVMLVFFFSIEMGLRFWLQQARGFRNKSELGFLALDMLATISLFSAILMPASLMASGIYLRLARLLRGMYMLRMLRVFRFLTFDTMVYSMGYSVSVLLLAAIGILAPSVALYIGVVLILEAACRAAGVVQTLEGGLRRNGELGFAALDMAASVSLIGLTPYVAPAWVTLRALRFLIMLNPLGNLVGALKIVFGCDEVRKETSMLVGMFVLLMAMTAAAVLYLYPRMDLSGDHILNQDDYTPWQVLLYGFRILLDPGNAPVDAFSPWLAATTMLIVLSGVFFFALFVGLGSNVMHYLIEELVNSPLSARESLLFAGSNEQALAILRVFDRMCARMRRSFASAWFLFGEAPPGARQIGRWLAVRQVRRGERRIVRRFRLSGIRTTVLFQQAWRSTRGSHTLADLHALAREVETNPYRKARRKTSRQSDTGCGNQQGIVICDSALPSHAHEVYTESLGMRVLDSSALKARMLYQMHHCAHMPELGVRMLDAVNGETGLYAHRWPAELIPDGAGSLIRHQDKTVRLETWLTRCFEQGLNILAARYADNHYVLFSNLKDIRENTALTDLAVLGREPGLWGAILRGAMDMEDHAAVAPKDGSAALAPFTWPETWDLHMIFIGWHDGLPAMMEEMAKKHHKLTIHVLTPGDDAALQHKQGKMEKAAERVASNTPQCALKAMAHPWDGLDGEALMPLLKGCKVIMLYPEDVQDDTEDSVLELWFHAVARLLDARKAKVKWWTPPKLMVLPRDAASVPPLRRAACAYTYLDIDVGSPDAFHDVFMARQLLSCALYQSQPEAMQQEIKVYDFMHEMLGDAVIVEGVDACHLLANPSAGWSDIYREAWNRGWLLTAYLLPEQDSATHEIYKLVETLFPAENGQSGSHMHLLAGNRIDEMDAPIHAARLLFCRRGVLPETTWTQEENEIATKGESGTMDASRMKDAPPLLCETAREGEIMPSSVWPKTADQKLLVVLRKQVSGSLDLLNRSTEDGLIKLTGAMDRDTGGELADDIIGALTDLQNIDRVMQRLRNVESCLADWASAQDGRQPMETLWESEMEKRYVMEEERQVLRSEL